MFRIFSRSVEAELIASDELEDVIYKMETEDGFTALGFFNVDKTTLTGLISTIVTYIIILLQWNND